MNQLKFKILSKRKEKNDTCEAICYLCETTLDEYVKSIPDFYTEYEVQRGIVTNIYLDKLAQTILNKKFIPPIVLISDSSSVDINDNILSISDYKILDGLQRTFRIKAVYNALDIYIREEEKGKKLSQLSKLKLSKEYKSELESCKSDTNVLWTICKTIDEKKLSMDDVKKVFAESIQWFEVWVGLDKKEQINKMLILNAGHKPMNIKHQLELIFLNVIPNDYLKNFERAKDIDSSFFYKNKGEGDLHLSHFISALLSFDKKAPINVDTKFVQYLQDNLETELESIKIYFEEENLKIFIDFMKKLDTIFNNKYPASSNSEGGLAWLGRETILIGLFAAFGEFYETKYENKNLQECLNTIEQKITHSIDIFKIDKFNEAKKTSIDITKVNIGSIFKKTAYLAMSNFLLNDQKDIIWENLFSPAKGALSDS